MRVPACLVLAACLGACSPSSPSDPPRQSPSFAASFSREAVAADHPLASAAGAEILAKGGNAVDAAVATSFALSVVRPFSCGIGGGGFMIIALRNDPSRGTLTTAINYRETAPAGIRPNTYADLDAKGVTPDPSRFGGAAVATPGTVRGLLHALERYGSMSRREVLAPAIRLAEQGFAADSAFVRAAKDDVLPEFVKNPALKARFPLVWDRFTKQGRVAVGDVIRLPEQARALRLIADLGDDAFYTGDIAHAIVRAVAADGGVLTLEDLRDYSVRESPPIAVAFRGKRLYTMPPPSSGGVVVAQVLGTLDARPDLLGPTFDNPRTIHALAEVWKHSFADRARFLADPAFAPVPLDRLLDPREFARRAALVRPDAVLPLDQYGLALPRAAAFLPDDHGTSHLSVIDRHGSAVACTETINLIYGSWLDVPEFGFVLNNEMDDFLTRPGAANAFGLTQAEVNLPEPGKRPLSSMTPSILTGPGDIPEIVAGASGGPRIISGTLQSILKMVVWNQSAADAVASPRFHHQWQPDRLDLEPGLNDDVVVGPLRSWGQNPAKTGQVGDVQVIRRDLKKGVLEAASDPRKGGMPAGR